MLMSLKCCSTLRTLKATHQEWRELDKTSERNKTRNSQWCQRPCKEKITSSWNTLIDITHKLEITTKIFIRNRRSRRRGTRSRTNIGLKEYKKTALSNHHWLRNLSERTIMIQDLLRRFQTLISIFREWRRQERMLFSRRKWLREATLVLQKESRKQRQRSCRKTIANMTSL